MDILAKVRDHSNNSWGFLVRWEDPDGKEHKKILPFSIITENNMSTLLSMLADGGYWVESPSLFRQYLKSFKCDSRVTCVDNTGWNNGNFVLVDTVYYAGNVGHSENPQESGNLSTRDSHYDTGIPEQIVLQAQTSTDPYQVGGEFEGWQNTIARWANGNSRMIIAICAAFAAILLKITGHENFGININGKSSSGKSTALQAGSSVGGERDYRL